MDNIDIGKDIAFEKILMIGTRKGTLLGHPYIKGVKVGFTSLPRYLKG